MYQIGELYFNSDFYIFVFQDKKTAQEAGKLLPLREKNFPIEWMQQDASALSKELQSRVDIISPGNPFLLLNQEKNCIQVLVESKIGWIALTSPSYLEHLKSIVQ
jgi:hypothetical protein